MKYSLEKSLVIPGQFVQAMRDSGYKGLSSALAELIDNAFEANASFVQIDLEMANEAGHQKHGITIIDNGHGMDREELGRALQFGWSSKFNSRIGLGRYGMGLPNSSLSQCLRVEVYSWQKPHRVFSTMLDVDEITRTNTSMLTPPQRTHPPFDIDFKKLPSGTIVRWVNCDRLGPRTKDELLQELEQKLGRLFRHYLTQGRQIRLADIQIEPRDPLLLFKNSRIEGARPFGPKLSYPIEVPNSSKVGSRVDVVFSLFPVKLWHFLSNKEKRHYGITKGAGISIVRHMREIDHGWYFMGDKRKENYDDWWRCEVMFEPELDEIFGVTHTKQGIRPTPFINRILAPDLSSVARRLNTIVRREHERLRRTTIESAAERAAAQAEQYLSAHSPDQEHSEVRSLSWWKQKRVSFVMKPMDTVDFFIPNKSGRKLEVVLNTQHSFYDKFYRKLQEGSLKSMRLFVDLLLFSFARTEVNSNKDIRKHAALLRGRWSNALATYFREAPQWK